MEAVNKDNFFEEFSCKGAELEGSVRPRQGFVLFSTMEYSI